MTVDNKHYRLWQRPQLCAEKLRRDQDILSGGISGISITVNKKRQISYQVGTKISLSGLLVLAAVLSRPSNNLSPEQYYLNMIFFDGSRVPT